MIRVYKETDNTKSGGGVDYEGREYYVPGPIKMCGKDVAGYIMGNSLCDKHVRLVALRGPTSMEVKKGLLI